MFLGRKKVSLNQSIYPALCSVYGLGDSRIRLILCKLGCVRKTKIAKLQHNKRQGLTRFIDRKYSTEKFLRKPTSQILRDLIQFGSYKGIRMSQGLPSNGQRTHSNASTAGRLRRGK